jgi:hypothetical protein
MIGYMKIFDWYRFAGFHQIVVDQFAADWSVFTVFNLRDANKVMLSQQINCIVL